MNAPGRALRQLCRRAAATRNSRVSSSPMMSTVVTRITQRIVVSVEPAKTCVLLASTDSTEIEITAAPAVITSSRLLRRSRIGFGRLLRGTDHAVFRAFWIAVPRPSEP